jgi:membrane-associated phospholipid phosphatase
MIEKGSIRSALFLAVLLLCAGSRAFTQELDSTPATTDAGESTSKSNPKEYRFALYSAPDPKDNQFKRLASDFVSDQKDLWTSPSGLQPSDATWLVPLSGFTAGLFVTDAQSSRSLSRTPSTLSRYNNISNAGIAGLAGGAGAMWLLSYKNHNEHWRETGFLAGAAALNSLAMIETMKYSFGRQRPNEGTGAGSFFSGGTSFPSEHSAAAWAIAGVIAHEYPGMFTKILAYGAATAVSFSRVHSLNHFQSDVLVGSLIGSLASVRTYKRHHDIELGGDSGETISDISREALKAPSRANMASPYVPLDNWVYPAMDRLIALGFIQSAMVDTRPWTRFECARLVAEAGDRLDDAEQSSSQVASIYATLTKEFTDEIELPEGGNNTRASLESAYTRLTEISGQPLSQAYHYDFGQTLINDFGRPYEQGFNNITGFSAWATQSRFVFYANGEFQNAGGAPPMSQDARDVIAGTQYVPAPPATPVAPINRFQLLDTYVGMTFENWQVTYGKQSLWWGPGAGGPMMFSNNAAPINMFRVSRVSPFKLPVPFKWMGSITLEFFLGQLSGHNFVFGQPTGLLGSWTSYVSPQPMISGERFSFKPTPNLEFGFSATSLFAGESVPFTLHSYLYSVFRFESNSNPGTSTDPGDSRSGFDLTYRLPFVRDWLTFYADGFTDDQISPVAYWDRAAWTGGLYLSHFPKIPKLDLRLEGVYTDVPPGGAIGRGFYYWNDRFVTGYTNNGNLMGSWIGRDGQGAQIWSNYWFTPKNHVQFNFRHEKVSQQFLPDGGSLTDLGVQANFWLHDGISINPFVQYERWLYPVIQPGPVRNLTASVEIKFQPQKVYRPSLHLSPSRKDSDSR